jgi:phage terminase large subunit
MDDMTFQCEIMANDVDIVDKPFAYAFDYDKHVKPCYYNEEYEIYLSFDFNRDPITCICTQIIDGQTNVFKEYKLRNSNIYELTEKIRNDFPTSVFLVTGDATGKSSSAMVKDSINYYTIIMRQLNIVKGQLKVPSVNPSIEQNRSLLNSVLQHGNVSIDPSCEGLIFDLRYVQVDEVGKLIKDRSSESAKADLLDCLRYQFNLTHKNFVKNLNLIQDDTTDSSDYL